MTEQLTWADVGVVAAVALGATALVGAAGGALVWSGRHRSLQTLVPAVAVVTMVAVVAGLLGAAAAMFLSPHDLQVVLVVAVSAGALGVALAFVLGRAVMRGTQAVVGAAHQLGSGEAPVVNPWPVTAELGAVAVELERAGARLEAAREREAAAEASRRELVAWVSHDLRTPLAGMRAMAEALEDGMVDEPAVYHRQIRHEVDRLALLVDDLFELSRIRAGALRLTMDAVPLIDLVEQSVAEADPLARRHGVRVEGFAAAGAVAADRRELSRAVANLVVNAIRHTPHDGTVKIHAQRIGDEAVLTVQDACGGIADDDLERVFETGFRGQSARTPDPDVGGGIGLAIVAGIVSAHQGSVDVVNHGAGCRFAIRLPLTAAAGAAMPAP
jgi:signal transduction histidine kinase